MERNTIELTTNMTTIVDENTTTKFIVPDPVCTGGIKEVSAIDKIIKVHEVYNLISLLWTLHGKFNLWVPTILRRVLSIIIGGGGLGEAPPPPHPQKKSSKRKRETEEVGNVYYLGAVMIHVNSIPLN